MLYDGSMKDVMLSLVVIIGLSLLSLTLVSINTEDNEDTMRTNPSYHEIEPALREGALLVDVRTDEEFDAGHVEGAIHLPLERIEQGDTGTLQPTDEIYLYCRTGSRSGIALSYLSKQGFTQLTNLGGYEDIVADGAPSCTTPECQEGR